MSNAVAEAVAIDAWQFVHQVLDNELDKNVRYHHTKEMEEYEPSPENRLEGN